MGTKINPLSDTRGEDTHDEAFFRTAALRALAEVPELQAVLLFGSRARGTARSNSDWDLALITHADRERDPKELVHAASATKLGQQGVEMLVFSVKDLQEKRNTAGTMVRTVLRTSRLLAGCLPDIGEIDKVARMDPKIFKQRIMFVCQELSILGWKFAETLENTDPEDIVQGEGRRFVAASADAAEHLAKLMMDRRDVTFSNTHKLNSLADDLEREGNGKWSDTVRKIRDMNGVTRRHHKINYPENAAPGPEDMHHAVRRVGFVATYLVEECQDVANDSIDTDLAVAGRWALEYLSRKASRVADLLRKSGPVKQEILESPDDHTRSAYALLTGYDAMCGVYDRLAAVRPN